MTRNYSPNHPAVRSWTGEPRQTVRQRTQAVRERRGIRHRNGKTADWIVIGASCWVMSVGLVETHLLAAVALFGVTVFMAWPWIRETIEEVRSWKN